ncbi:MAG: proton-conducting transporter membrane subunit [Bacillota bacterium]|nr:proton-conducting transporter membrane subunit [Bacillota bacterium]
MVILLLVAIPLAAGLFTLIGGAWTRYVAVGGAVLSLLSGAALVLAHGRLALDAATLLGGFRPGPLFGILDALLLAYIGLTGWRLRHLLLTLLALVQLAGILYLEGVPRPEAGRFVVDGLSAVMVLVVSVVGSLVALFSLPYMREYERHAQGTAGPRRFFAVLLAFLGLMNGLVLADDLHWVYFFWEATTLASFLLISHPQSGDAVPNAAYALTVNSLGGVAFVGALVLLAGRGEASLEQLAATPPAPGILVPLGLLLFAAFIKAAQFPFQRWLTAAMVAPTPVSALLHSSTMVKAAVYLVLRLAPAFRGTPLALAAAVYGAFSFFAGSATAIGQANGKKVLAYSTIANLGLIIACAGVGTTGALAAAILLVLFHAATKALLFLCVGTIEHGIGTRNIEEMEGVMWKMPVTTVLTVLAMLAMVVPPFGMLIGKWLAIESSVRTPLVLAFVVFGSAFTLVFWSKWIGRILTVSYHRKFRWERLPVLLRLPKLLLLLAVFSGSIGVAPLYNRLVRPVIVDQFDARGFVRTGGGGLTTGFGDFLPWPIFLVILGVLLLLLVMVGRLEPEDARPPYLCGENADQKPGTSFHTARDEVEIAETGNFYLESVFGEGMVRQWADPLALAILLLMVGFLR